jgi:hypothetical protein
MNVCSYTLNWVGHFWFQRDIPAVFSYGMQLKPFIWGECCQVRTSRMISS